MVAECKKGDFSFKFQVTHLFLRFALPLLDSKKSGPYRQWRRSP